MQREYLLSIYRTEEAAITLVKYLNFKSICVREQEIIGVRFDMERATKVLAQLVADSTLVGVESLGKKEWLIEIEAIAVVE